PASASVPPPPARPLALSPVATAGPSLRERVGQMLLVGFRGLTPDQAPEIVADIRDRRLGGVLLFDTDQPTHSAVRNIRDPAQVKALVGALKALASTPLLVAVDEEGGLVARLDQ